MPMSVVYTNFGGQIVHENRGGTERFFTSDPLGSIIEGRNSSGTQTFSFTYWPYGEIRTSSGTNPSQFDFVGALGYYRENSARTYVRARFLRKELGRWLNVDPLWPSELQYSYVRNRPSELSDYLGLLADRPRYCRDYIGKGDASDARIQACIDKCIRQRKDFGTCMIACVGGGLTGPPRRYICCMFVSPGGYDPCESQPQ